MSQEKNTKEKICAFYASDYHFEMISLPYIDRRMENNDEIVILTENDLEKTMNTLLAKINLKEDKKKKILRLNWKNNDLEKFKMIKEKVKKEQDIIIFIKGKENYIHNVNQNIEKWIPKEKNIKIIDCYDIGEVGENLNEVMGKYKKVLQTTGEKEIEKM